MGRLIVVSFISLDGVVEDPDGSDGTPFGGWAMRHGPQAIAGDKFQLGPVLETGTLLFGRRTWDHFKTLWPPRNDPFSSVMNAASKAVVGSRVLDEGDWAPSRVLDAPLNQWVRKEVRERDVVVIGSSSVVDQLADEGLIEECRLLTFPTVLGAGRGLFRNYRELTVVSTGQVGPAVLTVLR